MTTSFKIQVKETERFWDDFQGPLEKIISLLQSELDDGWEGIEMENRGYDGVEYYVYKHRLETDKEYERRIKSLKKREEKRRKEYEELKKEFEK